MLQYNKARNELDKQERVTSRAIDAKRASDNTAGELANTLVCA